MHGASIILCLRFAALTIFIFVEMAQKGSSHTRINRDGNCTDMEMPVVDRYSQ